MNNRSPIITGATADSVSIATKLDEARALIEKGWCRWSDAINAEGATTDPCAEDAVCFCLNGAICRVVPSRLANGCEAMLELATGVVGVPETAVKISRLIDWNDAPERTQAEVIEAFRKAADLARADAQ